MRLLLVCIVLLLTACNEPADPPQPQPPPEYKNDYVIGHYAAPARGLYTNSFWIEGPEGVIVIGTQLLADNAIEAVNIAESYSGKKVVMAIVLHAGPEQSNGSGVLQQRGIRVVSAASVVEQIEAQHQGGLPLYGATQDEGAQDDGTLDHGTLGEGYPQRPVLPEAAWQKTREINAAGLRLKVYVVRAGESGAHVLIELDDHLFVGNLVTNGYHGSLHRGRSDQWIERLEEIARFARPRVIHPGRGYAMAAEHLLAQQTAYLRDVQQAVAAFYTGGEITPADTAAIAERIRGQYPGYPLDGLLQAGIEAEWEQLRQQDHQMM